jgi:hypothetical protein
MTLTDHKDGDDVSMGTSYLEIARVLMDHGVQTNGDLRELWSRIVFNVLRSLTRHDCRRQIIGYAEIPPGGSVKEPVPIRSELVDERTWKRLLAASSPLVDCMAGKLGRALIGMF